MKPNLYYGINKRGYLVLVTQNFNQNLKPHGRPPHPPLRLGNENGILTVYRGR